MQCVKAAAAGIDVRGVARRLRASFGDSGSARLPRVMFRAPFCLRERLAEMLKEAGGEKVAAQLDSSTQGPKIDEIERLAHEVREKQRKVTAARES